MTDGQNTNLGRAKIMKSTEDCFNDIKRHHKHKTLWKQNKEVSINHN